VSLTPNHPRAVTIQLAIGTVFAATALLVWIVFLRPAAASTAIGTIRSKTYRPPGTYTQYQPGVSRGFRTPTEIPIAESYVFEIAIDGRPDLLRYSLNTTASERFAVGQRVRVTCEERTLLPFWRRTFVVDMTPLGDTSSSQNER